MSFVESRISVYTDSKTVVSISERGYSAGAQAYEKCVGSKNNYVKEMQEHGLSKVFKIAGVGNRADPLTKALNRVAVAQSRKTQGVWTRSELVEALSQGCEEWCKHIGALRLEGAC